MQDRTNEWNVISYRRYCRNWNAITNGENSNIPDVSRGLGTQTLPSDVFRTRYNGPYIKQSYFKSKIKIGIHVYDFMQMYAAFLWHL